HPEDRATVNTAVAAARTNGTPLVADYRIVRADGAPRVMHLMGEVIRDRQGEVVRIVGTLQDFSDRLAQERARSRMQQLELQERFMSHVSHELRSPVTAIYQFVTILLDRIAGELNTEQEEYLEIVHRNVHQLKNMISDLLEVSRAQT